MSTLSFAKEVKVAPNDLDSDIDSDSWVTKDSTTYAANGLTQDLHPAFDTLGIRYDVNKDTFAAEVDEIHDEATLLDSQGAFADALEKFQQQIAPKYNSKIDLRSLHTWDEVLEYAGEARNKYTGVGQKGVMKRIDHRLKTFQTAAPAIQAWLKLLPSTSWYGSIICGGLTIILEAAVHLRKVRKETMDALDQIPLCIEKAEFFMRTYGYQQVKVQTGNLYLALIESLQHILAWYSQAATTKYLCAFCKGPAYAENLKKKMRNVEIAAQAMDDRASQREQVRLKEIKDVTLNTNDQVGELKILAVEARNHLYAVLKDTEAWQEAFQSWKESRLAKESRRASHDQSLVDEQEKNTAAKKSLLDRVAFDHCDPSRDVETVLNEVTSMTLADQDQVGAIFQLQAVQEWLLDPLHEGLLIHGNGRRHDPISPTSVACASLIYVFSKKLAFPTIYWFCGLHTSGMGSNLLSMLRSLICQLLCLSCCKCATDDQKDANTQDFRKLLKLFQRLLRRSSGAGPIVCILDGVSYYESRHQSSGMAKVVFELANLATTNHPRLILLLTSPTRTSYIARQPDIKQNLKVTEISDQSSGAKQGLDSRQIMSSAETRARRFSESLANGKRVSN